VEKNPTSSWGVSKPISKSPLVGVFSENHAQLQQNPLVIAIFAKKFASKLLKIERMLASEPPKPNQALRAQAK